MSCNTPKNRCHPERLKKIADFRKESKDLRTNLTAKVPSVRRSFDSLRSLRMTGFGCAAKTAFCNTPFVVLYAVVSRTVRYAERIIATSRVGPMASFDCQTTRTNWPSALPTLLEVALQQALQSLAVAGLLCVWGKLTRSSLSNTFYCLFTNGVMSKLPPIARLNHSTKSKYFSYSR